MHSSGDAAQFFQECEMEDQVDMKAQAELKQFLKVVRPEWGFARSGGGNQLQQVLDKLRSIGVTDRETFVSRVLTGTINDNLFAVGRSRFSQKTLEAVKKHKPLMLALDSASKGPYVRQIGDLNPVLGLLSAKQIGGVFGHESAANKRATTAPAFGVSLQRDQTLTSGSDDASLRSTLSVPQAWGGGSFMKNGIGLRRPPRDYGAWRRLPSMPSKKLEQPATFKVGEKQPEDSCPNEEEASRSAQHEDHSPKIFEAPLLSLSSLKTDLRHAGWQEDVVKQSLVHGEDMLKEQEILDDVAILQRIIHKNNPDVRRHVMSNIQSRMQKERAKSAAETVGVDQRLLVIRNNIENLSNSRRELARLRTQWVGTVKKEHPDPEPAKPFSEISSALKDHCKQLLSANKRFSLDSDCGRTQVPTEKRKSLRSLRNMKRHTSPTSASQSLNLAKVERMGQNKTNKVRFD